MKQKATKLAVHSFWVTKQLVGTGSDLECGSYTSDVKGKELVSVCVLLAFGFVSCFLKEKEHKVKWVGRWRGPVSSWGRRKHHQNVLWDNIRN